MTGFKCNFGDVIESVAIIDNAKELSFSFMRKLVQHSGGSADWELYQDNYRRASFDRSKIGWNLYFGISRDGFAAWLSNLKVYDRNTFFIIADASQFGLGDARKIAFWLFLRAHYCGVNPTDADVNDKDVSLIASTIGDEIASFPVGINAALTASRVTGKWCWHDTAKSSRRLSPISEMTYLQAIREISDPAPVISRITDAPSGRAPVPDFVPKDAIARLNVQAEAVALSADIMAALEPWINRMVEQRLAKIIGDNRNAS